MDNPLKTTLDNFIHGDFTFPSDLNHPMQDVLDEYKEEVFGCSSSRMENAFLMPCNGIPKR